MQIDPYINKHMNNTSILVKLQLSVLDQHLDHAWIDEQNLQESVGIGFPAHK